MNKTAEYTKDQYLDVFFYIDKSDWEDVEYAKSRRKDAEKYLDQLLQAERKKIIDIVYEKLGNATGDDLIDILSKKE